MVDYVRAAVGELCQYSLTWLLFRHSHKTVRQVFIVFHPVCLILRRVVLELPAAMEPTFTSPSLTSTYSEVVHWRPSAKQENPLFLNLQDCFCHGIRRYESNHCSPCSVVTEAFKSKAKEHSVCLDRRLNLWLNGDLNDMLKSQPQDSQKRLAWSFANLTTHTSHGRLQLNVFNC